MASTSSTIYQHHGQHQQHHLPAPWLAPAAPFTSSMVSTSSTNYQHHGRHQQHNLPAPAAPWQAPTAPAG